MGKKTKSTACVHALVSECNASTWNILGTHISSLSSNQTFLQQPQPDSQKTPEQGTCVQQSILLVLHCQAKGQAI